MDHEILVKNVLSTEVLEQLYELEFIEGELEDNVVQVNTRRDRSHLNGFSLPNEPQIQNGNDEDNRDNEVRMDEFCFQYAQEDDNRPYPRVTYMSDDRNVFLIEIKRGSTMKKFIYVYGLIVDENRKLINLSVRFSMKNKSLLKVLEEQNCPLIDLSSKWNKETELFAFNHPVIWKYAASRNFETEIIENDTKQYRRLVRYPLRRKDYHQIRGALVYTHSKHSFVVYTPSHNEQSKNHINLSCEEIKARIDRTFQEIDFTNADLQSLLTGIDTDKIKEGASIYKLAHARVISDPNSTVFKSPNGDSIFKDYDEEMVDIYSKYFGQFYSLLYCFGSFPFISVTCTDEGKLIIVDLIQAKEEDRVEIIIDLFMHFNSEHGGAFFKSLLYPYLRRLSDGNYPGVLTLLVKLEAIMNFYKYSIFLQSSNLEIKTFSKGKWEHDYMGWYFIASFYCGLLNERGKWGIAVEESGKPGQCLVNGLLVKKDDITSTYLKAASFYDQKFEELCRITDCKVLMDEIFDEYLSRSTQDYARMALNEGIENGYFNTDDLEYEEKRRLLIIIDEMTRALATMMFLSSANSFWASDLFRLKISGASYSDRDMIFKDGTVVIRLNQIKGRYVYRRLCYTTKLITKLIIVHTTAVRSLYIRTFNPNFPDIIEEFDEKDAYGPEAVKNIFYKKFLFVSRYGRLLKIDDLYVFQAHLLNINRRDVLNVNVLRKAIAWFIKEEIPGGLNYYNAFVRQTDSIEQCRGIGISPDPRSATPSGVRIDLKAFFNKFFLYMGISPDQRPDTADDEQRGRSIEDDLSSIPSDKRARLALT